MISNKFSHVFRLLVIFIAVLTLFGFSAVVSAHNYENTTNDILTLLQDDARNHNLTFGAYMLRVMSSDELSYTNLGDLAANQILIYLENIHQQEVVLYGKGWKFTIRKTDPGSSLFFPRAKFQVIINDGEKEHFGTLTLHMDEIKNYINRILYPLFTQRLLLTG